MKCLKADLPRELETLELHVIADTHLGDPNCDVRLVRQHVKAIANKYNAYAILNGDIINNATATSVSDVYGEKLTPEQQIDEAVDIFSPIKDKILGVNTGNHERRTYKREGIDPTRRMAKELGIADKYSPDSILLFIRFGQDPLGRKETNGSGERRKICYTLYCLHGTGGGRNAGVKAMRAAALVGIVDVDIYVHSHLHMPMAFRESFFRTDARNSTTSQVDKLFLITAASLEYNGYSCSGAYKPASKQNPTIYLNGREKLMNALI